MMTDHHNPPQQQQLEKDELDIRPPSKSHYKKISFEQFRATDHLSLCSSSNEQFNTNCFTGVRVYDGSKILSAFLLSNERIQKFLSPPSSSSSQISIVELGCGCGLSGSSALEVLLSEIDGEKVNNNNINTEQNPLHHQNSVHNKHEIIFTDMQPACLEVATKNAERVKANHSPSSSSLVSTSSKILRWDEDGFKAFSSSLLHQDEKMKKKQQFNLILGAELIYFRVDMKALVSTIKNLLTMNRSGEHDDEKESSTSTPAAICLLCHVNRVTGGREELPRILNSPPFNLAYKNINMRQCLSACEESGYFDPSMSACFLDRVDFMAIALKEEDLMEVFSSEKEDFVDENAKKMKMDEEKDKEEFGEMSNDLF